MSTRRVIVEKPIAKEFTEKFVKKVSTFKVGNPKEPDTIIGPLINKQQFNQVKNSVDAAVRDGAKILCGGKSEGLCYYPTVLTNVKPGTPFSCEETFGPVVSVIEVKDEEEAVAIANDTDVRAFGECLHPRFHQRSCHCRAHRIGDRSHQRSDRS